MSGGRPPLGLVAHCRTRPPRGWGLRPAVSAAGLAVSCVLLAGCGDEPRLVPPAGQPPSPVLASPVSSTPAAGSIVSAPPIGEIVWTRAIDPATNAPVETTSAYPPDALRIIASVSANGLSPDASIEATWEYNGTSLDAFTTELIATDRADRSWVSFHIERDPQASWPTGVYEVAISLDGTVVQRATVEVIEQS